jgi:hypothetical protein
MNYRKKENSRLTNQLLEYRYFQNKFLNEGTNFTMNFDKEIIKMVGEKPEELSPEEQKEVDKLNKTTDDKKILAAVDKLNSFFGKN